MADVLLSMNSDSLHAYHRNQSGASHQARRVNEQPGKQQSKNQPTKKVEASEPLESSDEYADEYSNDFEDSQDVGVRNNDFFGSYDMPLIVHFALHYRNQRKKMVKSILINLQALKAQL